MANLSARTIAKLGATCAELGGDFDTFEDYSGRCVLFSVSVPDGRNLYDFQCRVEGRGFSYLETYTLNHGQQEERTRIVREYEGDRVADLDITLRSWLDLVFSELRAKSNAYHGG